MNNIPPKLRKQLALDPLMKICARWHQLDHVCDGRITWEHAMTFGGKQIQAAWAILPICAKGHSVDEWQDGGDYDRDIHEWIALSRASNDELEAISRAINYKQRLAYLDGLYGPYMRKLPPMYFAPHLIHKDIHNNILSDGSI